VEGLNLNLLVELGVCEGCFLVKRHILPFSKKGSKHELNGAHTFEYLCSNANNDTEMSKVFYYFCQ
jgi:hypothetical protein